MSEHLVRIPQQRLEADDEEFVLVLVKSKGPRSLDLSLTATNNRTFFITTLKHDRVPDLQAGGNKRDSSLWEAALSWILLHTCPDPRHKDAMKTLDLLAIVEAGGQLIINVRQSISGIIQRLGSLTLTEAAGLEEDIFLWAGIEAGVVVQQSKEIQELRERYDTQQSSVTKLQNQLDDFTKHQHQREEQILEQFRQLLNTKKLKIRDQQRLLSGAQVNPQVAHQVQQARQQTTAANATGSRKRKGAGVTNGTKDRPRSPTVKAESDLDTDDVPTPQRSDDSDVDEAAFEVGPSVQEEETRANGNGHSRDRSRDSHTQSTAPPPPRQLPFELDPIADDHPASISPAVQSRGGPDVEEDEETDDEL